MLPRIERTEWEVVGSTELVGTGLAAAPEFGRRRPKLRRELAGVAL